MAAPELEPSLRPSDVAGKRFPLGRKGYDPDQVDRFLESVAEHLGRLESEVAWLRARSEHFERRSLAAADAAYARLSRDFMEVLRRADEAAALVRLEAEARARADVAAAGAEASRLIAQAVAEADGLLAEARAGGPERQGAPVDPFVSADASADPFDDLDAFDALDLLDPLDTLDTLDTLTAFESVARLDMLAESGEGGEDADPTLFQAPDGWRSPETSPSNGHAEDRTLPIDVEEADFDLNTSIFDLFDDQD